MRAVQNEASTRRASGFDLAPPGAASTQSGTTGAPD
jgi:hypothetical protein